MKNTAIIIFVSVLMLGAIVQSDKALAAGGHDAHIENLEWSFDGPFGTYDRGALQRGLQVYRQVCSACHSMKHMYYRNIGALGYNEAQVKAIASEYMVEDGPDDEGEMFSRPGKPSDRFVSPFPNRKAATYANNGAFPPDLSLITKARAGGADYVYSILTGYEHAPKDAHLLAGQHWNKAMAGNVIAMAPPLADGMIAYEDGTAETVEQYSRDVAHFLTWAAAPDMEERKRIGIMTLLFLAVFASIMYAVKRKVWSDLKK